MRAARYEREFCEYADARGFHAERVAGSGRGLRSFCDVTLIKEGRGYLVEVKSTKDKTYYISDKTGVKERLNELIEVAERSGAIPLLAVRFKGRGRKKAWVVKKLTPELQRISRDEISSF